MTSNFATTVAAAQLLDKRNHLLDKQNKLSHRIAEAKDLLMEHYGELTHLEPEALFLW